MLPAREHLETVEAAADKVDLLLEIWEELAVGNAAAEARFDGVAALQFPLHAAVEPDIATAAQLLRRVHRDIGAAEQGVDAAAIMVRPRDPDGCADMGVNAGEIERLAEDRKSTRLNSSH